MSCWKRNFPWSHALQGKQDGNQLGGTANHLCSLACIQIYFQEVLYYLPDYIFTPVNRTPKKSSSLFICLWRKHSRQKKWRENSQLLKN